MGYTCRYRICFWEYLKGDKRRCETLNDRYLMPNPSYRKYLLRKLVIIIYQNFRLFYQRFYILHAIFCRTVSTNSNLDQMLVEVSHVNVAILPVVNLDGSNLMCFLFAESHRGSHLVAQCFRSTFTTVAKIQHFLQTYPGDFVTKVKQIDSQ